MREIIQHKKRIAGIAGALVVVALLCVGAFFASKKITETASSPVKSDDQSLSGSYGMPETLKLGEHEQTKTVASPPIQAKFAFNAIAPHWKERAGGAGYQDERTFKVRVSDDSKKWSDWLDVPVDGPLRDNDPHPDSMFPETPLFIEGKFYQYSVTIARPAADAAAPEISDLVMTYIDSRESSEQKISKAIVGFFSPKVAHADSQQGPGIIKRAAWGNPEPNNSPGWTPGYTPVSQIFIHHTVNANGSGDFAAVVRGIWQFHTYTRGWGDIGYNYLVDGNGAIYEGRFGGDNVTAGHVLGFNAGSMGVALIGCFQSGDPTCRSMNGGDQGPSGAMMDSLYNLLGWKAKSYELDLHGNHTFCGNQDVGNQCRNLAVVAGHRDGGDSSCPGNIIYDQLPSIRDAAESRRANLFPYAAKQLSYGVASTTEGQSSITLQFKNTGTATWRNASPRFFLKTAAPDDRTSDFQGTGWVTSQHPALLNESSVPPGGTGTFTFNITGANKAQGIYYEGFRLVAEGVTDVNSDFVLPIQAPTYTWSPVSTTYSSGSSLMSPGQTQNVTVVVENTGTATWKNDGPNPMRIGTWPPDDHAGILRHSSWLSPTRPATMQQSIVAPGDNATFTFTIQAPSAEGEYGELYNLVSENRTWSSPPAAGEVYVRVANPYKWQPVSVGHSTGTAMMDPGDTQTITIIAKNVGTATWTKNGTYPVRLGTWQPGRGSATAHSSWLNPIRPAELQETSVAPGSNGTFVFTVRAGTSGEFFERVNLVAEGLTWFNDPGLQYYLNVRGYYAWQVESLNHSSGTAVLPAGSTVTLTLRARNIGNVPWRNNGDFPVRLGTAGPLNRGSALHRPSWIRDFRPVGLQESVVTPGNVGTFVFEAKVPSTPGEYRERFSLVAENITWFNDPGMYFYIKSVQ